MEYRPLGNTDLHLSVVGFGTAAMGRDPRVWGPTDDNESIAAIHTAVEAGVNWIETSPGYGNGHAEEVTGRAVQDHRDQVMIAGSFETPSADALGARRETVADVLTRDLDASLRRLRSDHLDIYLCHVTQDGPLLAESVAVLSTLMSQGKVRAFGVLPGEVERMNAWRSHGPLHVMMGPGNLLESRLLRDTGPAAARQSVGFLVCSPLCRGLLSGNVTATSHFDDFRARDLQFQSPRLPINVQAAAAFAALAARRGESAARFALAWVLSQVGVTAAVVGIKRASQIRELAQPFQALSDDDQSEVERILSEREARLVREK